MTTSKIKHRSMYKSVVRGTGHFFKDGFLKMFPRPKPTGTDVELDRISEFSSDINGITTMFFALYIATAFVVNSLSSLTVLILATFFLVYLLLEKRAIRLGYGRITMVLFAIIVGLFWLALTLIAKSLQHTQILFLGTGLVFITIALGFKYGLAIFIGYQGLIVYGAIVEYRMGPHAGNIHDVFKHYYTAMLIITAGFMVCSMLRKHFVERIHDALVERNAARQELQDLLEQKTQQLEVASIENRRVFVKHEQFANLGTMVSGLSHELGTPLGNAVLTASNMKSWVEELNKLESNSNARAGVLGNRIVEGAQIITRNLDRANNLVNTFKQVSLDQLKSTRQTVHLADCVEKCTMLLIPTLSQNNVQIELNVDKHIDLESYPFALEQIITNLITNAVRHGLEEKPHGLITISATTNPKDDTVCIEVHDNGVGIPKWILPRIFEPFFTTKRGYGGTGMGLSIVQHLVTTILDGSIDVQTSTTTGTSFLVTIPRESPEVDMETGFEDPNQMELS